MDTCYDLFSSKVEFDTGYATITLSQSGFVDGLPFVEKRTIMIRHEEWCNLQQKDMEVRARMLDKKKDKSYICFHCHHEGVANFNIHVDGTCKECNSGILFEIPNKNNGPQ